MIAESLDNIRGRISRACGRAGRDASAVTLVAVSKTFPADCIREAADAGVVDFGENYVQELLEKHEVITGKALRWHFIGHLQRNKVRFIAPWITMVHAVDGLPLAREIHARAKAEGRIIDCLVEVNTTGEESKFGVRPDHALRLVREFEDLTSIRVNGFMTIGPFLPDPEGSRPMFRRLRELRDEAAASNQENAPMHHLSMGMTGDFEVAIEEGATLVRIGTAIFGARKRREV
ncbi:MAG: YggS family pyridoxal phosphate-dependent enzyme [Bacteroidota bacterium]